MLRRISQARQVEHLFETVTQHDIEKHSGLIYPLPYKDRERVSEELEHLYDDVHDSLRDARECMRDLERETDHILYGETSTGTVASPFYRMK